MIPPPRDLQIIGDFVALRWADGREDVIPMEALRAASPSAETQGEPDLFGRVHGRDPRSAYPGVRVEGWDWVGGYAIRFLFSDRHQSGLYSFAYLRRLAEAHREPS